MLVNPPSCRSGGLQLKDHGASVAGGPFTTLNFTGGVSVTNDGGGQATILITGTGSGSEVTDVPLIATGDPRVWLTPVAYAPTSLAVYHNGKRLKRPLEYVEVESGGVGTGYDSIRLVAFTPSPRSVLISDYQPA